MVSSGVLVLLVVAFQAVGSCPSISKVAAIAGWSYDGTLSPVKWQSAYPECGGVRQSPINIDLAQVVKINGPHPAWKNYNLKPATVVLVNNGHTVQVKATRANPKDGKNPQIVMGSKTYELDQTHFHWGKKNTSGSEHTINRIRYPLEMHAVHRRVENGTQVSPPEVIVMTVLFEISAKNNVGLEKVLKYASSVKNAETEVKVPAFPVDELIHPFTSNFFSYQGSLTTPPCSQVVTFFIKMKPATVSQSQMERLRSLLNHEKTTLGGNFRPVQPLNGRKVYYVMPEAQQMHSHHTHKHG